MLLCIYRTRSFGIQEILYSTSVKHSQTMSNCFNMLQPFILPPFRLHQLLRILRSFFTALKPTTEGTVSPRPAAARSSKSACLALACGPRRNLTAALVSDGFFRIFWEWKASIAYHSCCHSCLAYPQKISTCWTQSDGPWWAMMGHRIFTWRICP